MPAGPSEAGGQCLKSVGLRQTYPGNRQITTGRTREVMTRYSSRGEIQTRSALGLSMGPELICVAQDTLKLEQKITQLFETLRDPLHRYVSTITGDPAEAEEITQDAFLRLYSWLHRGRSIVNIRSWVFRVAHNLAMERRQSSKFISLLDSASWDELAQRHRDLGPTPEEKVVNEERFERLHAALARLSPQERLCMDLRAEGFRYREIADVLGIGMSTVGEFLVRAIRKLKREANG
jgi:RNA polymerase sigma-70 factor (ECF subfamily)